MGLRTGVRREGRNTARRHHFPSGRELRVGGKVDRVDGWIKDDKLYLRVVDYKSGKKKFDLANVRMGLDIQMLLYLFALQKEGAEFFGKEIEPAGVLYLPARDEILPAERGISQEALQKEREKTLKRSGLLLEDPAVLQAMEHEALTEPHYLPLRVGKDGNLSGSLASAAGWGSWARMWTNCWARSPTSCAAATSTRIPAATARRTASAVSATGSPPVSSAMDGTGTVCGTSCR